MSSVAIILLLGDFNLGIISKYLKSKMLNSVKVGLFPSVGFLGGWGLLDLIGLNSLYIRSEIWK